MDSALWWIGLAHVAAYVTAGSIILLIAGTVKLHMWFKVMGRIVQWHNARFRWQNRNRDGLTEAEWQRGEPRP